MNFDPIWSWPKPVQAGGPPIWLGANSRWCYDRVAEYCDGWLPIGGPGSGGIANMRAAVEKAGRNPDEIELALFAAPRDPDQLAGRIEQGFSELVFGLPQAPADKVLAALDSLAETVARIR